jgi:hypothetical protein
MKAPAFSLDYFPSREVAWSLFRDPKIVLQAPMTSMGLRSAGSWDYFDTSRIGTYGSAGSSNGPWVSDVLPSGPQTPYSTGNTPPILPYHRSHRNSVINSLSTSPEQLQQHRGARRSNSNLSAALSSFSRPFAILSSSPSTNDRFRAEADISTSAPTTAITWGSTTFYSGGSSLSPEKRRRSSSKRGSFAALDSTYSSTDGSDAEFTDYSDDEISIHPVIKQPNAPVIKVTLKNQHLFDEEAHASVPLLPPVDEAKYAAYREVYADQLSIWGLFIQRAEILKFNGLTNYWPNMSNQQSQQSDPASNTQGSGDPSSSTQDTMRPEIFKGTGSTFPPPFTNEQNTIQREKYIRSIQMATENPDAFSKVFKEAVKDPYSPNHPEFEKRRTEELLRHGAERNKMLEKPGILRVAQLPGEEPLETTERMRTTCIICRERIRGVFVACPTGIHRAHWDCHHPQPHSYLGTGAGISVYCACPVAPGQQRFTHDSNGEDLL